MLDMLGYAPQRWTKSEDDGVDDVYGQKHETKLGRDTAALDPQDDIMVSEGQMPPMVIVLMIARVEANGQSRRG
jgi:hypothetical protein